MRLKRSFGQYLREQGRVSTQALDEAVQKLVLFGGRLGTRLLEAGELDADGLETHLSDFLGVPRAPAEWFEAPTPEALAALPANLVRIHAALPLKVEAGSLHVAMQDPKDTPRLEALANGAQLRIVPYVVSEGRLAFLLERHLAIRPERHFESLREQLVDAKEPQRRGEGSQPRGPRTEDEQYFRERERLGITPLGDGAELTDPESFASLLEDWDASTYGSGEEPAATPEIPQKSAIQPEVDLRPDDEVTPSPRGLAQLQAELDEAGDRNSVTRAALSIASFFVESASFFVVHKGLIFGVLASRDGKISNIETIVIPMGVPSMLSKSASSGTLVREHSADGLIDVRLARALGHGRPREVAAIPVVLSQQVVSLLRLDNGDHAIGPVVLAAATELAARVADSYARVILERKRRYCGSSDE